MNYEVSSLQRFVILRAYFLLRIAGLFGVWSFSFFWQNHRSDPGKTC